MKIFALCTLSFVINTSWAESVQTEPIQVEPSQNCSKQTSDGSVIESTLEDSTTLQIPMDEFPRIPYAKLIQEGQPPKKIYFRHPLEMITRKEFESESVQTIKASQKTMKGHYLERKGRIYKWTRKKDSSHVELKAFADPYIEEIIPGEKKRISREDMPKALLLSRQVFDAVKACREHMKNPQAIAPSRVPIPAKVRR